MSKLNPEVSELIIKLDPKRKDLLTALRVYVLESAEEISEHIKWNSPAYHYTGELLIEDPKRYSRDMLVLNLRNAKHVLLIFPTGALVHGVSPILTGDYADGRRMITVASQEELDKSAGEIAKVIRAWINAVKP